MAANDEGSAANLDRHAVLASRLQAEDHHLTVAILEAFRRTDWDELEQLTGDLTVGLARLAAAAAWIEQKRGELHSEDARRHREAQHRAALSIVDNHQEEWASLIRRHRAEIDAERDNPAAVPAQQTVSTPAEAPPRGIRRLFRR